MNRRYRLHVGTQLSRPENTTNLGKLQGLGPIKHRNEHSVYYTFSSVYNTKQQGMDDKQTEIKTHREYKIQAKEKTQNPDWDSHTSKF